MNSKYLLPLILFSLPCTSCTIGFGVFEESGIERESRLSSDGVQAVRIISSNGHIRIVPSDDGEQIRVRASISINAGSDEKLRKAVSEVTIGTELVGDVLTISILEPPTAKDVSASFDLEVPEHLALNAETSNGAVRIEGQYPSISANTSNGSINLRGPLPDFSAVSSNGIIQIDLAGDWSGTGSASTSNGSITINCDGVIFGEVNATTANGKFESNAKPGSGIMTLRTSNGSIRVDTD